MEKNNSNEIHLKVRINLKELYEFIIHSNYICIRGYISVIFSLAAAAGTFYYWNEISTIQRVLMIFMAMLFTVVAPVEYYVKARRQIKKNFNDELEYTFDERGITIAKDDEKSSLRWDEVMKVISTRNLVVVYFTPVRAFIIPKSIIGNQFDELRELMQSQTSCYKFVMKK